MKANYVDIRYNGTIRRFRYPIRKDEILDWLLTIDINYIEELALVGYQLPNELLAKFGPDLQVLDVLPINVSKFKQGNWRFIGDSFDYPRSYLATLI